MLEKSVCYCDQKKAFEECCGLFISEKKAPKTPLELMRSRYTGYVLHDWNYIRNTMQENFAEPSHSPNFVKLEILDATDTQVEFKAYYIHKQYLGVLHERSDFAKLKGRWIYTSGTLFDEPRQSIALNSRCPCESGKKFKNCHGAHSCI